VAEGGAFHFLRARKRNRPSPRLSPLRRGEGESQSVGLKGSTTQDCEKAALGVPLTCLPKVNSLQIEMLVLRRALARLLMRVRQN
jgi:hypothetical protein